MIQIAHVREVQMLEDTDLPKKVIDVVRETSILDAKYGEEREGHVRI